MAEQKIKIIAENRKARHDFTIYETFEAGIALTGTEVKSLRAGKANMKDSYAQVTRQAEVFVYNLHISPYDHGNIFNHDPLRSRRLLLHRAEINKLIGKVKEKGYARRKARDGARAEGQEQVKQVALLSAPEVYWCA